VPGSSEEVVPAPGSDGLQDDPQFEDGPPSTEAAPAGAVKRGKREPWRDDLLWKQGELSDCLANVFDILLNRREWAGVLAYDEFAMRVVKLKPPPYAGGCEGEWDAADDSRTAIWLTRHEKITPSSSRVAEAVEDEREADAVGLHFGVDVAGVFVVEFIHSVFQVVDVVGDEVVGFDSKVYFVGVVVFVFDSLYGQLAIEQGLDDGYVVFEDDVFGIGALVEAFEFYDVYFFGIAEQDAFYESVLGAASFAEFVEQAGLNGADYVDAQPFEEVFAAHTGDAVWASAPVGKPEFLL